MILETLFPGTGLSAGDVALIYAMFVLGGMVKGLAGFGMPLVVVSTLANVLPVPLVLAINILPPVVLNLWQLDSLPLAREVLRRFWLVPLGIGAGTTLGAFFVAAAEPATIIAIVGSVTLLFAGLALTGWRPQPHPSLQRPLALLTGAVAGVIAAFTTANGPPLVMYLFTTGVPPQAFKAALALFFLTTSAVLVIAFSSVGFLTGPLAVLSLTCTLPALVGMWGGRRLARRIDARAFERIVLLALIAVGLNLLRRAAGY